MDSNYTQICEEALWNLDMEESNSEDVLHFLKDASEMAPFGQRLARFISAECGVEQSQASSCLKERCKEAGIPLNSNTVKNWFSKAGPKKGDHSRDNMLKIAFALGLNPEQTNRLFHKVYLDRGLDPRRPEETAAAFCLRQGQGWTEFQQLVQQLQPAEESPAEHTVLTTLLQKDLDEIKTAEQLRQYVRLHPHNFQIRSRSAENKLKELTALNGNQSLVPGRPMPDGPVVPSASNLGLTEYPTIPLPDDFGALSEELLANDPALQSLEHESLVAQKQLSVSRQGWLPQLELGYRRNTETRHPLNGLVVGFSFPIFQNHGKVKTARAQAQSIDFQKENTKLNASTALWQLYDEACNLHASIKEYNETFRQQQDLKLLRKALEGGEISMIEYFVEVSVVYQSQSNLLQLENQYQKVMARIYKSRL